MIQPLFSGAYASPPYFTDDPYPAALHNLQLYLYGSVNTTDHTKNIYLPTVEADYGLFPNFELDLTAYIYTFINRSDRATGPGDTEVSIKWAFVNEHDYWPTVAIAPALELPTGDPHQNLGNVKFWYQFPIWFGKTWPRWITTAGFGYGVNNAANMSNYFFGGWEVQHFVTDNLIIGGEIYSQGAIATINAAPLEDTGSVTLVNFGATYNLTPNASIQAALGHSIAGTKQWSAYLGYFINLC